MDQNEIARADVADERGVDVFDTGGCAHRGSDSVGVQDLGEDALVGTGRADWRAARSVVLQQPGMFEADVGQLPQQVVQEDEAPVVRSQRRVVGAEDVVGDPGAGAM